jgi:outer membrane protein assembly factor BamA
MPSSSRSGASTKLGYFKPMEGAPSLQPNGKHDDQIDVHLQGGRAEPEPVHLRRGVSGLEGAFLNASFQTANFLGAGDTVSLSAQTGRRTKNYQLAVHEALRLRPTHHRGHRPLSSGRSRT